MDRKIVKILFISLALFVLLLSAACGGKAPEPTKAALEAPKQETEPTATAPAAVESPTEPAPAEEVSSGALNRIADAKQAIIQVEAQGSFVDPQVGQVYNSAGRGSGFIIDPSGLAVTNNHVVTGRLPLPANLTRDADRRFIV